MRSASSFAQRLLRLERAAEPSWAAANGKRPVTGTHPPGVYSEPSQLWQPTFGSCAGLSRTAQSHRPHYAPRAPLHSAALQGIVSLRPTVAMADQSRPTACKTSPSDKRIKSGSPMLPASLRAKAGCTSSLFWTSAHDG